MTRAGKFHERFHGIYTRAYELYDAGCCCCCCFPLLCIHAIQSPLLSLGGYSISISFGPTARMTRRFYGGVLICFIAAALTLIWHHAPALKLSLLSSRQPSLSRSMIFFFPTLHQSFIIQSQCAGTRASYLLYVILTGLSDGFFFLEIGANFYAVVRFAGADPKLNADRISIVECA